MVETPVRKQLAVMSAAKLLCVEEPNPFSSVGISVNQDTLLFLLLGKRYTKKLFLQMHHLQPTFAEKRKKKQIGALVD